MAILIASSSPSKGMTARTGPNTSSCAIRISISDIGEDRRLDKLAALGTRPAVAAAAENALGALLFRYRDVIQYLAVLRFGRNRTDMRIR